MRTLKGLPLAACAWILLAVSPPAHADGLSKFNDLVKSKLPPDALTYKSAKALGDNGFELDDAVFTPPPDATAGNKAEPIKIKSIVVDEADFDQIAKQAPPNYLKMRIQGIDVSSTPAAGIDLNALAGIDKLSADFQLDYRIDPAKKTLTANRIELDLNGLARLELSMVLDNYDPAQPDKAMNDATLRTASLVYDDHSLLAKSLPAAAKSMSMTDPAAMIGLAKTLLDAMRAGQGDATQNAFDALESYMEDYKSPKGPLRVTLSPPDKVTAATISGAKGADDVIKTLGIKVDYAGTRKMTPAAAAPAPAAGSDKGGVGDAAKDAAKDAKGVTKDEDDDNSTKDVTKGK